MNNLKKVYKGAIITTCKKYRYLLTRGYSGNPEDPFVLFIGLNPSIADSEIDDPTLRRCLGFMEKWDLQALKIVNLFAYRATNPNAMLIQSEPIGMQNDRIIEGEAKNAKFIILCWGNTGSHLNRDKAVINLLEKYSHKTFSFGLTKLGQPKHPLYLSKSTRLERFLFETKAEKLEL